MRPLVSLLKGCRRVVATQTAIEKAYGIFRLEWWRKKRRIAYGQYGCYREPKAIDAFIRFVDAKGEEIGMIFEEEACRILLSKRK